MLLQEAIFAALLAISPKPLQHPFPGWDETVEAHRTRLESVSKDFAAVARTRAEAATLIGIARHESGFAPDVHAGDCYRKGGFFKRCDGGRAVSLFQLQGGLAEDREEWRTSTRAAATEALRRVYKSLRACQKNPSELRLAAYASGRCTHGFKAARELDGSIKKALSVMPVTVVDSES